MKDWIYYLVISIVLTIGVNIWVSRAIARSEAAKLKKLVRSFADQMVKENQAFLNQLGSTNLQVEQQITGLQVHIKQLEQSVANIVERIDYHALDMEPSKDVQAEGVKDLLDKDRLHLQERYGEVFELVNKGLTIEEISRRLGFGKGELELILQLAGVKSI